LGMRAYVGRSPRRKKDPGAACPPAGIPTREIKMAKKRSLQKACLACAAGLALALTVCSPAAFSKDERKLLSCDDSMKSEFRPDSLTTVLLVKAFKQNDPLTLGTPTSTTPIAANDVCMVKLLVGPGN